MTLLSMGAVLQKSGTICAVGFAKTIPPNIFFDPGKSPRSMTSVDNPAFEVVIAAETPAGPAPTITTSNFSGKFSLQPQKLMPTLLTPQMGASGSLFIATIVSEFSIPTRCWTAPDIPRAMYNLGRTVTPV